jgi:hypothetical protein
MVMNKRNSQRASEGPKPPLLVMLAAIETMEGQWLPEYFFLWLSIRLDEQPINQSRSRIEAYVKAPPSGPKFAKNILSFNIILCQFIARESSKHLILSDTNLLRGKRRLAQDGNWIV